MTWPIAACFRPGSPWWGSRVATGKTRTSRTSSTRPSSSMRARRSAKRPGDSSCRGFDSSRASSTTRMRSVACARPSNDSTSNAGRWATMPSTSPSPRKTSRWWRSSSGTRDWSTRMRTGTTRGAVSSSRSRSGTTSPRRGRSMTLSRLRSRRIRSSGSTTTSAKRRSRTSWPSGSPTSCSSPSGTATTSTTCRSRWPKTSAWVAAQVTTTGSARHATSSRTTSCNCSP